VIGKVRIVYVVYVLGKRMKERSVMTDLQWKVRNWIVVASMTVAQMLWVGVMGGIVIGVLSKG